MTELSKIALNIILARYLAKNDYCNLQKSAGHKREK